MNNNVSLMKGDIAATLTTWIYCAMWQLHSAEKMGLKGFINWPRDRSKWLVPYWDDQQFDKQPNAYSWYLKQPLFSDDQPPPQCDRTWTWENCPELGTDPLASKPLEYIKAYYQKNLRFSDAVEARGQALAKSYGVDFSKTIGLTWRGTDCVTDGRPRIPIEVYYPFLDEALEMTPGARIMCTAEETGILDPLLARYPQAFVVKEFASSPLGSMHNPERLLTTPGYERGMTPALMVWLFSKCAHFCKNRSSTGAVASWLSAGRIVSIAHRETLDYTKLPDHAEVEGKLVPLKFP